MKEELDRLSDDELKDILEAHDLEWETRQKAISDILDLGIQAVGESEDEDLSND